MDKSTGIRMALERCTVESTPNSKRSFRTAGTSELRSRTRAVRPTESAASIISSLGPSIGPPKHSVSVFGGRFAIAGPRLDGSADDLGIPQSSPRNHRASPGGSLDSRAGTCMHVQLTPRHLKSGETFSQSMAGWAGNAAFSAIRSQASRTRAVGARRGVSTSLSMGLSIGARERTLALITETDVAWTVGRDQICDGSCDFPASDPDRSAILAYSLRLKSCTGERCAHIPPDADSFP
jgi:hypothetical protein